MNEDEGEWFGRQDHPLLNHVILEKVFEYVRKRDLLACRIVSKKWNVLTIPFMHSNFLIGIQLPIIFLKQPRTAEADNNRRIEDFVDVFSKNTLGIPFAKFCLGPFCTTEGIGQKFFTLCGDTTTDLRLRQEFKVEDVSELLKKMTKLEKLRMSQKFVTYSENVVELFSGSKPKLSYLKSLFLECDDYALVTAHDTYERCPTFHEELITVAENISDLIVHDHWRLPAENDRIIRSNSFQVLTVIEKLGRESSILSLTILAAQMTPHVELISRMAAKSNGFMLKKLTFSMDYGVENSDHLQLVQLFKDTLENLDMRESCSSFINFLKMPKLRCLGLCITNNFDSTLVNLNKIFPVLKGLRLYQGVYGQVYDEFLPQSEPCPTIKSFCLGNGLHLKISAFNHVLTIFPRLTELRIEFSVDCEEILRQIWTRMTQLESLSISGILQTTDDMDSLVTGFSIEKIQEISDAVNNLKKMTVGLRRESIVKLRNQHCQFPSIGNLTNLRCLELKVCGDGWRMSYLTDVSGFLGFYSLKHLSRLVVRNTELTKTCCEMLTEEIKVGLESWTFTTREEAPIIPHRDY